MDTLVKLTLEPLGVWTTPWQADTLMGALASAWAKSKGVDALYRDFLDPWNAHEPLFVISDAFPGDSLSAPACLPLWWDWPEEKRKKVKQARWLQPDQFRRIQQGKRPDISGDDDSWGVSIENNVRLRNSISRATDTTGEGGELFEVPFSNRSERRANTLRSCRERRHGNPDRSA